MSKTIAVGTFIGIFFGVLSYFIFPDLLKMDVQFNQLINQQLGYGSFYYSVKGDSIWTVGVFMPIFWGLSGALVGFIVAKLKKISDHDKQK